MYTPRISLKVTAVWYAGALWDEDMQIYNLGKNSLFIVRPQKFTDCGTRPTREAEVTHFMNLTLLVDIIYHFYYINLHCIYSSSRFLSTSRRVIKNHHLLWCLFMTSFFNCSIVIFFFNGASCYWVLPMGIEKQALRTLCTEYSAPNVYYYLYNM